MNEPGYILIADDLELNRAILSEIFRHDYGILEADNGYDTIELIRSNRSRLALVLLDLVMPRLDGYEVLKQMRAEGLLRQIPVVVVTSEDSAESEIHSFDLGASDIIMKPFEPHVVKRRANNVIELYRHKNNLEHLVEIQAQKLQTSNEAMIDALSSVIEYRNLESGQHIRRIRLLTKVLLERVVETPYCDWGPKTIGIISSAASMHDIGKIVIPDSILNKPGKLTPAEFEIMKSHTVKGSELINNIIWMNDREYLKYASDICHSHHERWDGRGYPDGLKGEEIPLAALVVGVADVYDALTSERVYKPAFSHDTAVKMILNGECGLFPDWLLNCFIKVQHSFDQLAREYADKRILPAKEEDLI